MIKWTRTGRTLTIWLHKVFLEVHYMELSCSFLWVNAFFSLLLSMTCSWHSSNRNHYNVSYYFAVWVTPPYNQPSREQRPIFFAIPLKLRGMWLSFPLTTPLGCSGRVYYTLVKEGWTHRGIYPPPSCTPLDIIIVISRIVL